MSDEGFISRWSRRKTASKAGPDRPTADAVPAEAGTQSTAVPAPVGDEVPKQLPPVESLTPESDFTPFMKPEVDADTKRAAVKMLFQDPRYNVMDGLDVYIDDYSKPDPLPEGWLAKMNQVARLGEYVDPERVKPEPDRENAEKDAEKILAEQQAAAPPDEVAADTPAAGMDHPAVKECPPSA